MKKIFCQYRLSLLFSAVILYLCFAPPRTFRVAPAFSGIDKAVHLVLFCLLTALCFYEFNKNISRFRRWVVAAAYPATLGLLIEILQKYVFTYRSGDWLDWLCDLAGVALCWAVFFLLKNGKKTSARD